MLERRLKGLVGAVGPRKRNARKAYEGLRGKNLTSIHEDAGLIPPSYNGNSLSLRQKILG